MIKPLDEETVSKKRTELQSIINELSTNNLDEPEKIREYVNRLAHVYSDGYRQMYSDIYPLLRKISSQNDCDFQMLGDNLEQIRKFIRDNGEGIDENLYGMVLKLSDHVNLEIQRFVNTKNNERSIENLSAKSHKVVKNMEDVSKKVSTIQVQFVTILAIFATIIMAFSGGLTVIGDSFSSMSETETTKLLLVILITGLIMFDIIAMMLHFVKDLIGDLYQTPESTEKDKNTKISSPVVYINIMIIIAIFIDVTAMISLGRF